MTMNRVDICIPVYEDTPSLHKTLASIKATADMDYNLIVKIKKQSCSANRIDCLAESKAEYVVWLDDDILFTDKKWLSRLVEQMDNDLKIGIIGVRVLHYKLMHRSPTRPSGIVSDVCGACFIMRKVPGVEPDLGYLGGQWEDTDICYQMRALLHNVIQDNSIEIIHLNEMKNHKYNENEIYFKKKWGI